MVSAVSTGPLLFTPAPRGFGFRAPFDLGDSRKPALPSAASSTFISSLIRPGARASALSGVIVLVAGYTESFNSGAQDKAAIPGALGEYG